MFRALVGLLIGGVARIWLSTLRVCFDLHPSLQAHAHRPWVLALWHGQMLPLLAFRRRKRTVALVSRSRDGQILAGAFRVLDLAVERGSSSRDGRLGLAAMVERLLSGWDAAFAVDGPRGPRGHARAGALAAAERSGAVIVPFAASCSNAIVLRRSWDRFEIPLPFSQVSVVLGAPLCAEGQSLDPCIVGDAIDACTAHAQRALTAPRRNISCSQRTS